jgi:hypothetical protein
VICQFPIRERPQQRIAFYQNLTLASIRGSHCHVPLL